MATRPRASKTSFNPQTTTKGRAGGGDPSKPSRAHRDDTFEAREQQRRLPKTHPTRNARSHAAARKDK
jgi:hypothetical protein